MTEDQFKIVEDENGIVIYDESDDYVPEDEILDEDDELDTDYILREAKRQVEQETKEKHLQRWISAGVILAVVSFIAGVCYLNFKDIL